MIKQRTLKNTIRAQGIGAHSGQSINLTFRPAPVDTGIVFQRTDLAQPIQIKARAELVGDTRLSTTLIQDGVRIGTIEHLLSALAGMAVDNVLIEIDGPEVPIMDGSASPFVFLMQAAGLKEQDAPKRFLRLKETVRVGNEDAWAQLEPYEGFKASVTVHYNHPVLKALPQSLTLDFGSSSYVREIARARTFGFMADHEKLKAQNLALGSSLDNTVVVDDERIVNKEGLRYKDEFVKHKILDAVGDLYLFGMGVIAAFSGFKSGHSLNNALVRQVLAQQEAWEIVHLKSLQSPLSYLSAAANAA